MNRSFFALALCGLVAACGDDGGDATNLGNGGNGGNGSVDFGSCADQVPAGIDLSGLPSGFDFNSVADCNDLDADTLENGVELGLGTNLFLADTDGDGISDADEIGNDGTYDEGVDTDPRNPDTDNDGTPDGEDDTALGQPDCIYPEFSGRITRGQVFPDFAWDAKLADGTDYLLDMVEFYCDDDKYGDYNTMAFGISTEWCGFCPQWQQYMDYFADQLAERGMLLVMSEVQNGSGGPIDSARANEVINAHTDQGNGIRLGDASNIYEPNGLTNGQGADFYPTAFVVRRSDMQIIAHARDASSIGAYLPFAEIAEDPNADWSNPPAATITPDVPQPEPNCTELDEEDVEAGADFASAVTIGEGTIDGGLCVDTFDYYFVDVEGAWSADLQFTHAIGDLDIYVLDDEGQQLTGDDGRPLGSESTDDNEYMEYEGPANIVVVGYQGATATYSLTISAIEGGGTDEGGSDGGN